MKTKDTAPPKLFIGIDIHKRSWNIHMSTDLFDGRNLTVLRHCKAMWLIAHSDLMTVSRSFSILQISHEPVHPVMQHYYRSHAGKDSKAILVKVARTLAVIKTETPYQIGVVE